MWKIGWAPNNASRWQIGLNSAFKGLMANIRCQKFGSLLVTTWPYFSTLLTIHSWDSLLQFPYGLTVTSFTRIMSSGIGIHLLFHVRRREVWCSFPMFRWKGRNFESKKPKEQSAACVVASSQRENKSVAPERHEGHRIYVLHIARYGVEKNAFASLGQSIHKVWFCLSGEVPLQRSPFNP